MVDLLARNRNLEQWLMTRSRELAKTNHVLFSNDGNFIDFEERLLLDELPRADYSRGGVYFFGASNMKWAFTTLDLPAKQRQLIGIYGIGASSHATELRLIRYLIEHRGFLRTGERNLVIIGATFQLGRKESRYFSSLLRRRGLLTLAADDTMVPVPMNVITRWLTIEKARSGGFIWNLGRLAKNLAKAYAGRSGPPQHNPARYRQGWREYMGSNWRQELDPEMEHLRQTISLVRSQGAKIAIMLLPQATWIEELPFQHQYEEQLRALCEETSTPLIDFSQAIRDEDFVDSSHLTVKGQEDFRQLVLKEISGHLRNLETSLDARQ
jgi:hypothetical protein